MEGVKVINKSKYCYEHVKYREETNPIIFTMKVLKAV